MFGYGESLSNVLTHSAVKGNEHVYVGTYLQRERKERYVSIDSYHF